MIKNEADVYTAIAQAAIVAIEVSASNITAALSAATANILGATTTALGDINTRAAILIQSDVDLLAKDLQTVVTIIRGINATVTVVSTSLGRSTFCHGVNPQCLRVSYKRLSPDDLSKQQL